MKKLVVLVLVIFSISHCSQLNAQIYKKGDNLLNAGIGVGVYSYGGLPIGASFEHGITEEISGGVFFDYLSWKNTYYTYNYSWRFMYFGARASYHVNDIVKLDPNKIDLYVGAGLGYYVAGTSDNLINGYKGYSNSVFFNAHAGGRYYFNEKFGAFAEVGYGVSALKLGLTLKL